MRRAALRAAPAGARPLLGRPARPVTTARRVAARAVFFAFVVWPRVAVDFLALTAMVLRVGAILTFAAARLRVAVFLTFAVVRRVAVFLALAAVRRVAVVFAVAAVLRVAVVF